MPKSSNAATPYTKLRWFISNVLVQWEDRPFLSDGLSRGFIVDTLATASRTSVAVAVALSLRQPDYLRAPLITPAMKLATLFIAVTLPLFSFAQMDSLSHSLGILLAKSVQSQGIPVDDTDAFVKSFKATIAGNTSEEEVAQAQALMQRVMTERQAAEQAKAAAGSAAVKAEGAKFLAENGKRPEVKTTASGLQYMVLQEGSGDHPSASSNVTVHYTGKNLDGSVFDSSVERGQPATFPLNDVIAGWTEGVQLMKPGAKYRFWIPSDLAYGERGAGADIAPGATLMFDVELLSIQ